MKNTGSARTGLIIIILIAIIGLIYLYTEHRKEKAEEEKRQVQQIGEFREKWFQEREESRMELSRLQKTIDDIGDVNLDPIKMTFSKINDLFHERGHISKSQRYRNTVTASWLDGVVEADFIPQNTDNAVAESAEPVEITINNREGVEFRGSIYGIHLGDTVDEAISNGRRYGCIVDSKYSPDGLNCKDISSVYWLKKDGHLFQITGENNKYLIH